MHQHNHSHCHDDSCCSREHKESCSDSCHDNHHHSDDDPSHFFLELADQAWMEVLKEKIKEQIRSHSGAHLDDLAKIISETNSARWKNKMAAKKGCKEFQEKLSNYFRSKEQK